jgi:gas vesicle protein
MATDAADKVQWFLLGAITGAAVALLYAPQSGEKTRKLLGKKADEGREVLSETGKEVFDRGREIYEKSRKVADDAADLFDRGRKLVRG